MVKQEMGIQDLVEIYMELQRLSPQVEEWGTPSFMENPPRQIRWQMLHALYQGLGLPGKLPDVFNTHLSPKSKEIVLESLLQYRRAYLELRDFWPCFLEAPEELVQSFQRLSPVQRQIEHLDEAILLELIRHIPAQRTSISREELILCFAFPDVDLEALDEEWW